MTLRLHSTAVMARRVEPADSLDYFPTPPWATRAGCEHVLGPLHYNDDMASFSALDPACGEGHMALGLADYFGDVRAADIFPYGFGDVQDFLHPDYVPEPVDWIITNPPFNRGLDFVRKALRHARQGVAVLVRAGFLEGEDRYARLFFPFKPTLVAHYVERVPMHRGRWVIDGTTATAYCWLVWARGAQPLPPVWIPKSRKILSRPDDWLRFSGCIDLPADHRAMKLQRGEKMAELQGGLL